MDGNTSNPRPQISIPSPPMYNYAFSSRPHILTSTDITTINYTLEWSHLENPSNTTFAGSTQIDICRCPRSNPPSPNQTSEGRGSQAFLEQNGSSNIERDAPGHIYTRYRCLGPEVQFKSVTEQLWVLDGPHGPINMLRPATLAEWELRSELHENAEPAAYAGKNILLLTGPCPRGRYQAHATLQYLRSLSPDARRNLERLSLLIQPYEEDCIEETSRQAYSELAEYILQYLPSFKTLHLNVWDDEQRMRSVAGEFSILLHKEGVDIVVGWNWCKGEAKHYTSARAFLEAMSIRDQRKRDRLFKRQSLEDGLIQKERKQVMGDDTNDVHDTENEDEEAEEDADFEDGGSEEAENSEDVQISEKLPLTSETTRFEEPTGDTSEKQSDTSRPSRTTSITHENSRTPTGRKVSLDGSEKQDGDIDEISSSNKGEQEVIQSTGDNDTARKQQEALDTSREDGDNTDDDWTDAELSPISPQDPEEGSWQVF